MRKLSKIVTEPVIVAGMVARTVLLTIVIATAIVHEVVWESVRNGYLDARQGRR